MCIRFVIGSLIALVGVAPSRGETPLSTAFTYQGQLKQGGAPLEGTADFVFTLWDAAGSGNPPTGGTQVGGVQAINALPVTAGLFSVTLNPGGEFGGNAFNGNARWVQVAVRSPAGGGGSFTTLAPRQPLTPTPHALQTRGIYVDPAQRAGIGTLSPTHTLTLQSTDNLSLRLIGPTSQYGYGGRLNFGDGDFAFLQEDEDDKLSFQAGRFAFSGGYVGVGTTAPASPVDIVFDSSAQTPQLTLRETDLDYARLTFRTGYLPEFWTIAGVSGGQAVNDRLNFYYSATGDILSITGDGKVGIGTTNPEGILHVAGQSGDNSVILPTDAIGRNEILDEPGLASRLQTWTTDESLQLPDSVIPIMSRTMVAPGAGYILAMAYLEVFSSDDSLASAGISPTAGVFGTEEFDLAQSVHGSPWGLLVPVSVSLHTVYAIQGPGSYTYYLNARSWWGQVWLGDARLTLLYFPTAYGVVDVSSTADLNGLAAATQPLAQATDTPLATSTTGASSTTARSEEINNSLRRMLERQQATIEELLQRVGVLEGKSDP